VYAGKGGEFYSKIEEIWLKRALLRDFSALFCNFLTLFMCVTDRFFEAKNRAPPLLLPPPTNSATPKKFEATFSAPGGTIRGNMVITILMYDENVKAAIVHCYLKIKITTTHIFDRVGRFKKTRQAFNIKVKSA